MGHKIEIEWFKTSEKSHPDKPGKSTYEQIACLVDHKRQGLLFLVWNCEHLCWDGADGDDHFCDISQVSAWAEIPKSLFIDQVGKEDGKAES